MFSLDSEQATITIAFRCSTRAFGEGASFKCREIGGNLAAATMVIIEEMVSMVLGGGNVTQKNKHRELL